MMIAQPSVEVRETGLLTAKPPFDFDKSLTFITNFSPIHGDQEVGQTLTKAIRMDGYTVGFRLGMGTKAEQVEYRLFSDRPLPPDTVQKVVKQIAFFLSLEDDLTPFYTLGKADPVFAPVIERLYGLHHVKFLTLCEAACWAILSQHQPIPVSRKLKRALLEAVGSQIEIDSHRYWAFPEWEQLLRLSVDDLNAILKNERRAGYLYGVVQALSQVDEQWLRSVPYEEAEAWLRRIKGIGEWSAGFLLLRALGRTEHMLLDLKPFLAILPKAYGPEVTMAQLADYYGDWFGYWGFYMRTAF